MPSQLAAQAPVPDDDLAERAENVRGSTLGPIRSLADSDHPQLPLRLVEAVVAGLTGRSCKVTAAGPDSARARHRATVAALETWASQVHAHRLADQGGATPAWDLATATPVVPGEAPGPRGWTAAAGKNWTEAAGRALTRSWHALLIADREPPRWREWTEWPDTDDDRNLVDMLAVLVGEVVQVRVSDTAGPLVTVRLDCVGTHATASGPTASLAAPVGLEQLIAAQQGARVVADIPAMGDTDWTADLPALVTALTDRRLRPVVAPVDIGRPLSSATPVVVAAALVPAAGPGRVANR